MANGDDSPDVPGTPLPNVPGDDGGGGSPAPQPPTPPTANGGPVVAALMRQRGGPPISAPGPGNQADSMNQLKTAVDMITKALPGLGTGTPIHTAAINALRQLSRHLAQGGPTAGVQQTALMDMLRRTVQGAMLQRVMAQNQQAPPGSRAPTPSTPLPGA